MRYTAINIGPIVATITLTRKPRELWSASYLFSFLMECIIDELKNQNKIILSPASIDMIKNPYRMVGLYPDRVYVEGIKNNEEVEDIVSKALTRFTQTTGISREYINVMYVSIESETDKDIIKNLNYYLDCTELFNHPVSDESRIKVLNLIHEKNNSALFKYASKNSENSHTSCWKVPCLAEVATQKLSTIENKNHLWMKYLTEEYEAEDKNENSDKIEDEFYRKIKDSFKEEYRSYYKYICVVQADGDNMGKIISALGNKQVKTLSTALMQYGCEVSKMIEEYGGMPIYAGGDDLLFIAPVVSGKLGTENIFQLLSQIDKCYKEKVDDMLITEKEKDVKEDLLFRPMDEEGKPIHTTLSYGLSISYYKYPLYEALQSALDLLFKAKNVTGKNAVAWCLRKHSGSGFNGSFTKDDAQGSVYQLFKLLAMFAVDDGGVSAISHKLRANEDLLNILRLKGDENRIAALYDKIMQEGENAYIQLTRNLLCALLRASDEKVNMKDILSNMYGMLRTAKFINGEGDIDE